MSKQEFDRFASEYETLLERHTRIGGEETGYFASYKVQTVRDVVVPRGETGKNSSPRFRLWRWPVDSILQAAVSAGRAARRGRIAGQHYNRSEAKCSHGTVARRGNSSRNGEADTAAASGDQNVMHRAGPVFRRGYHRGKFANRPATLPARCCRDTSGMGSFSPITRQGRSRSHIRRHR
jgi:hypothetical protein